MSEVSVTPRPRSGRAWRAGPLRASGWLLGLLMATAAAPALSDPVSLYTNVGSTLCSDEGLDSASCMALNVDRHDSQVSREETAMSARAAFGSLGVEGLVIADSTSSRDYASSVSSSANARFRDMVTISAPGLDGTAGTISFRLLVDGGFAGSAPASVLTTCAAEASWSFVIRANDGEEGAASVFDSTRNDDGTCTPGGPLALLTSVDVIGAPLRFTYGTPFSLDGEMSLFLDTRSDGGNYSFLSATYLHTGALGGIAGVRDASGRLVDGYAITALSGTDYTKSLATSPVPLPATAWLLGVGLAGLALRRRR